MAYPIIFPSGTSTSIETNTHLGLESSLWDKTLCVQGIIIRWWSYPHVQLKPQLSHFAHTFTGFVVQPAQVVLEPSAAQWDTYNRNAAQTGADREGISASRFVHKPAASTGIFGELMRFTCCAHDFTTTVRLARPRPLDIWPVRVHKLRTHGLISDCDVEIAIQLWIVITSSYFGKYQICM